MKSIILTIVLGFCTVFSFAQKINYNLNDGYIAQGYDVVAYFNNKAIEGKVGYSTTYDGVKYKFANQENLNKFKSKPLDFAPQYGGWCAYALGAKNKKVDVDGETFEIRDNKLYLFYNSWGNNTFENWLNGNPVALQKEADAYWNKIKYIN